MRTCTVSCHCHCGVVQCAYAGSHTGPDHASSTTVPGRRAKNRAVTGSPAARLEPPTRSSTADGAEPDEPTLDGCEDAAACDSPGSDPGKTDPDEPELEDPELDDPELDEPEMEEPELDDPELDEPELDGGGSTIG